MKIVIALGGNAILRKGQRPTLKVQEDNVRKALVQIFPLIKKNKVVITHGNGPQVGYLLLKQSSKPLDVLGAQTEGQIGYLIQQNLQNLFRKHRKGGGIVTILTQVLVRKEDEAFKNPEKFIGPFYKSKKPGTKKDPRGGWRRVVPSPKPIKIIERKTIDKLLKQKVVVIAAGGGGIPVVRTKKGLDGVEAVIDKDLASACLAKSINAQELVMITDVDKVYLNYKKKNQKGIKEMKLKKAKEYYASGEFPPGNMGPKIKAAINFLEGGGKKVIITNVDGIGRGGTEIKR